MSGVISRPAEQHHCNPGVRWAEYGGPVVEGMPPPALGRLYAIIPTQYSYPAGTVWACDCGKTWVSCPPRWDNAPGDVTWRRERWWERRRRERRG